MAFADVFLLLGLLFLGLHRWCWFMRRPALTGARAGRRALTSLSLRQFD